MDSLDCVRIAEVSDGRFFAGSMFQLAFGHELPDFGHHLVCFYPTSPQEFVPLGYLNFLGHASVMLVGGGVTSGTAFRHVSDEHSALIRSGGGVLFHLLRFGFRRFADQAEAYFGYAGDARAREVDLQAGFEPTGHEYLLAHFHRPLSEARKRELIEEVLRIGPF